MKHVLMGVLLATGGVATAQSVPSMTRLTDPQDDYPDYSPDGARIVFQSNRAGNWQLWLMNRDGSGLRPLTTGKANDRQPSWSPDGRTILFSSDRGSAAGAERRHLHVLDVGAGLDGAEARVRRLLESPGQDIHPKWTRDGRGIVFNRIVPGQSGRAEIMTVDRDGGAARVVPLPPGMNTYASLTPDRRRLVFRGTTAERVDGRPVENSDIFSAAPDGSDRRRLTDHAAFDGWPAIAPDGATIAFASRRAGQHFQIFLMPVAGGEPRQVTTGTHHHTQPAWSPDGKRLAVYRWLGDRAGEAGQLVEIDLTPAAPATPPAT